MYNQLECSSNYSDTTDSLWFSSKYERTNFKANISDDNGFSIRLNYNAKLNLWSKWNLKKTQQLLYQTWVIMIKGIKLEGITYQKVLIRIIITSSTKNVL